MSTDTHKAAPSNSATPKPDPEHDLTTAAARELVPGDVIRLRLGDIVPADPRLLDGDEIEVD